MAIPTMIGFVPSMTTAAISAVVAFLTVAFTHIFTNRRDDRNRRREQRIHYLVDVYRAFSKASNHPRLYEVAEEIEQAVADVQLFGTPLQVKLVQQFADDIGTRQSADLNELLIELRDSLRAELKAAPLPRRHVWLRLGRKKEIEDGDRDEECL